MKEIVQELIGKPELIEAMLASCGKMSLALMANKLRSVERENTLLRKELSETNGKVRDVVRGIDELAEKCRQLQTMTNRKIETVQNQVDELKTSPATVRGKR